MPIAVFYKYIDDQGPYLAAIVTYYGFIAIFPLLLLATSILGFLLQGNPGLQEAVLSSALRQFPIIGDELGRPDGMTGSTTAVVVGSLTALYGALGLGQALQNAQNIAWSVPRHNRPNPVVLRLKSLVLLASAGVAVLGVSVVSALGSETDMLGVSVDGSLRWVVRLVTMLLVGAVLTALFRLAAARRLSVGQAAPGAFVVAALHRRLTWETVHQACVTTLKASAMVLWIIFGATVFVGLYVVEGGQTFVADALQGSGLGRWGILILMQIILVVLGMFLDWVGILLLCVPIFVPIMLKLQFDGLFGLPGSTNGLTDPQQIKETLQLWFGVVYMAEQEEPIRRRVALKVIKPGMDTKQVIARFEAERQALALLEHPNIASVHDAGTTKRRAHRDQCELEAKAREKPVQVHYPGRRGLSVGAQGAHVPSRKRVSPDERHDRTQRSEEQALIEDQVGVLAVLTPARLRNESHGPDAQDLGHRHDQEPHVARGGEAGDRRVAVHLGEGWHVPRALMPTAEKRVVLLIDPPFEQADELSRCVQALTEAHTAALEQAIGEAPEQYFWHHKRWKKRPEAKLAES